MGYVQSKLNVDILLHSLSHLATFQGEKTSEPYLWAVYFKVDGDTIYYDANSSQLHSTHTVDDPNDNDDGGTTGGGPVHKPHPHPHHWHQEVGKPIATLDMRGADGEGDLGFSSMNRQDLKNIAASMGKYHTVLSPIRGNNIPATGVQQIGGWVGMVLVLMEADATPSGARYLAFTRFFTGVAQSLMDALTAEAWTNVSFTTGDFKTRLDAMTANIRAHVRDTIVAESTIDPDDLIGVSTIYWSHMQLEDLQNPVYPIVFISFDNDWQIDAEIKVSRVT